MGESPLSAAIGMTAVAGKTNTMVVPYSDVLVGDPDTGVVHGGVITALLDSASGMAVRNRVAEEAGVPATREEGGPSIATLDLRIDYMRPARPFEAIYGTADCYRTTTNVAFVRAWAYQDDETDPVATSVATFMLGTRRAPIPAAE